MLTLKRDPSLPERLNVSVSPSASDAETVTTEALPSITSTSSRAVSVGATF